MRATHKSLFYCFIHSKNINVKKKAIFKQLVPISFKGSVLKWMMLLTSAAHLKVNLHFRQLAAAFCQRYLSGEGILHNAFPSVTQIVPVSF